MSATAELDKLITGAIMDARAQGRAEYALEVDTNQRNISDLDLENMADIFRSCWNIADSEGRDGERVTEGLRGALNYIGIEVDPRVKTYKHDELFVEFIVDSGQVIMSEELVHNLLTQLGWEEVTEVSS